MWHSDAFYLALSLVVAAVILAVAERLHHRGWSAEASRKFVHLSVGHIAFPLVLLVHSQTLAVLPTILFTGVNYLALKSGRLKGMATHQRRTYGTVYFPASLGLLLLTLWAPQHRLLVLGAAMLMTWGDGLAAVLGGRFGRRFWHIAGDIKSLEGSLTMLLAGFLAFFLSVWWGGSLRPDLALRTGPNGLPLGLPALLALSLLLAVVATLLEGLSARGLDNLSVPLGAAAAGLALLLRWPGAPLSLASGLTAAGLIGWAAFRKRALTASGALAATLVGGIIFGLGGWLWGLLVVAFFVSSSVLTAYRQQAKAFLDEKYAKTGARDAMQTLANGGLAALLALWHGIVAAPFLFAGFLGVVATVNADTWATELGALARRPPRLITSLRRVPRGTSGGVTILGTLASLGGALLVALLAWAGLASGPWLGGPAGRTPAWLPAAGTPWRLALAATLGGLVGSLTDSLLGASLQAVYRCPACRLETEQPVHRCGTKSERVRGLRRLDNDLVNLLSSAAGGLVTLVLLTF